VAVRFGAFTFDAIARQVLRGSAALHLSPKAFDLLALLIERRTEAVSRIDIHTRLWPNTFVSDGSLAVLVTEIRDVLGDDAGRPVFVQTVHRFGYRFIGNAAETSCTPAGPIPGTAWLSWGTHRVMLGTGQNLLGRGHAADVRIDAVGISRRHAIIVVAPHEVTLNDLASKNGTFVNGIRVNDSMSLGERADIQLGSLSIQFVRLGDISTTETLDLLPAERSLLRESR